MRFFIFFTKLIYLITITIVFYSVIDKYRAKKEEYVNMESNVKVSDV